MLTATKLTIIAVKTPVDPNLFGASPIAQPLIMPFSASVNSFRLESLANCGRVIKNAKTDSNIPEIGLRFKFSSSANNLVYSYPITHKKYKAISPMDAVSASKYISAN